MASFSVTGACGDVEASQALPHAPSCPEPAEGGRRHCRQITTGCSLAMALTEPGLVTRPWVGSAALAVLLPVEQLSKGAAEKGPRSPEPSGSALPTGRPVAARAVAPGAAPYGAASL